MLFACLRSVTLQKQVPGPKNIQDDFMVDKVDAPRSILRTSIFTERNIAGILLTLPWFALRPVAVLDQYPVGGRFRHLDALLFKP